MSDLIRTTLYDELEDRVIESVTYDPSAVLDMNAAQRAERQGPGKYKGNLVHAARVHMGDVERLNNLGYNLLSHDPDEVRRALLYIQSEEKNLLTVDGTPFARKRAAWE
jgi:hypothetical protein